MLYPQCGWRVKYSWEKRLNIWINMHILCCQSHMAKRCTVAPIGFAIKKIFLLFLPFSLCPLATAHTPCCCKKESIITNEPLWVFLGRSFPWSSHESSCIDFSDQTNVLWSFLSTPTSVLTPPTSASAEVSSSEGHVCLFPSNWKLVSKHTTVLFCLVTLLNWTSFFWILIWTSWG